MAAATSVIRALAISALGLVASAAGCDQGAGSQSPSTPPAPAKGTKPMPDPKATPAPNATKPADPPKGEPDPASTPANPTLPTEKVSLGGKTFKLEVANTQETRFHGLSGRTTIAPDGGMLFVFTARNVDVHGFVMRDCPVPIDIIYLDPAGRIVSMHKMTPEPPRTEAEKKLTPPSPQPPNPASGWATWPKWTWTNAAYEARLKQYSSGSASQFVIELKGNTLDALNLKKGQKVELDLEKLKKAAQ